MPESSNNCTLNIWKAQRNTISAGCSHSRPCVSTLPPGVSGSGGINRSTKTSTAAPSSGVKNTHGPGLTAWGGSPANGRQGIPVPPAQVRAPAARAISSNAVEASNARQLGTPADDLPLTGAEFVVMAFPSFSAAGFRSSQLGQHEPSSRPERCRSGVHDGVNDPPRAGPSKFK
jgi:hypothetical protein